MTAGKGREMTGGKPKGEIFHASSALYHHRHLLSIYETGSHDFERMTFGVFYYRRMDAIWAQLKVEENMYECKFQLQSPDF